MRERLNIKMGGYVGNRDHDKLYNRDGVDQHPIESITGLAAELDRLDSSVEKFTAEFGEAYEKITTSADRLEKLANSATNSIINAGNSALDEINRVRNTYAVAFADTFNNASQLINDSAAAAINAADDAQRSIEEASQAAVGEFDSKINESEAWAVGTRDGEPLEDGDLQYQNNAKYYAELAQQTLNVKLFVIDAEWDDIRTEQTWIHTPFEDAYNAYRNGYMLCVALKDDDGYVSNVLMLNGAGANYLDGGRRFTFTTPVLYNGNVFAFVWKEQRPTVFEVEQRTVAFA